MKRVYAVGIGPGSIDGMTLEARKVLADCQVLAGYQKYIDLIREAYPDKELIRTGMRQEQDRCRAALAAANEGKTTAMVCSGDAGVYGMAGLLYALVPEYPEVEVFVIPGVTAAVSAAALLGAPLTNDFAVISMSDLLTPYEVIEKRILLAAEADFAICLYNPSSKNRQDYLKRACELILRHKSPDTVCGYVRNIGRDGETRKVMTLDALQKESVDMFTTVIIGNRSTQLIQGKMVTDRGYQI